MTTIKKMTKADYFRQIMANYPLNEDEKAFVEHELELLAKKNSAEKKPTAQQTANEGLKSTIIKVLTENGGLMTVTDVQKSCEELSALSNQRISALLRQLKEEGKVERVEDKRKAYFKAV